MPFSLDSCSVSSRCSVATTTSSIKTGERQDWEYIERQWNNLSNQIDSFEKRSEMANREQIKARQQFRKRLRIQRAALEKVHRKHDGNIPLSERPHLEKLTNRVVEAQKIAKNAKTRQRSLSSKTDQKRKFLETVESRELARYERKKEKRRRDEEKTNSVMSRDERISSWFVGQEILN